jgi:DNA-binding MarR family transcriptional regulator
MRNFSEMDQKKIDRMHSYFFDHIREISGSEDISGIELASMIRMIANCYESAVSQNQVTNDLSGPRMAILMRLMAEEEFGKKIGMNPTSLSRFQNVKKNTISSLLKGLEEQGLIERTMDAQDKRVFLIRITQAGRELIHATAPGRLKLMNELASGLDQQERDQLISLLGKLRKSMSCHPGFPIRLNTPKP